MPKKAGRPPTDPSGTRHKVMSFRPTSDVKEWLDKQVASGQAHSIATAIIDAIRDVQRRDEDIQDEIVRAFGGQHNLDLGRLAARIAVGIEHKRKKSWTESPEGLFQVLLAIVYVFREFLPKEFNIDSGNDNSFDAWADVAAEVLEALNHPERPWWPLADIEPDESIIPVGSLLNNLQPLTKGLGQKIELHSKLQKSVPAQDWLNLYWITDRNEERIAADIEKEIEEKGLSVDQHDLPELMDMAHEKRWSTYLESISASKGSKQKTKAPAKVEGKPSAKIYYIENKLKKQSAA